MNRMTTIATRGLVLERIRIARADRVLIELSLAVAPGEVATVMGPSGVGKSTLLAYVGGFLAPAFTGKGRVKLDGVDVTDVAPALRRIGVLFQDDLLFPHLSVAGNLLFALDPQVRGRKARRAAVDEALAGIGLDGFGERDPATLSGGQRAHVALARVLLSKPRALLLDEPFSRLDAGLRDQIRQLVFGAAREHALPVLLVTHDAADAAAAGGPVVAL